MVMMMELYYIFIKKNLVFDSIFLFLNILERLLITLNAVSVLMVISVVQSPLLVILGTEVTKLIYFLHGLSFPC